MSTSLARLCLHLATVMLVWNGITPQPQLSLNSLISFDEADFKKELATHPGYSSKINGIRIGYQQDHKNLVMKMIIQMPLTAAAHGDILLIGVGQNPGVANMKDIFKNCTTAMAT